MESIESVVNRFKRELQESGKVPAVTPTENIGAPEIDTARRSVEEVSHLRDEWADACLALAEALDWGPVEYKQGHTVCAGQAGWRIFCKTSNLTVLRDQALPALMKLQNRERPCSTI
jgi:hypothetical protein